MDINALCVSDVIDVQGCVVDIAADGSRITLRCPSKIVVCESRIKSGEYVTLTDSNRTLFHDAIRHPVKAILRVIHKNPDHTFQLQAANGNAIESFYRRRYRLATSTEIATFLEEEKNVISAKELEAKKQAEQNAILAKEELDAKTKQEAKKTQALQEARERLALLSLGETLQLLQEQIAQKQEELKKN